MSRRPHWSWVALALMLAAATLFMYLEARGMTFRRDDWNMILTRRGSSLEDFLRPHNRHLLPLHALAYKGLLETFGLRSLVPFQALALALHALVTTLLFVYARRRVTPALALAVAAAFTIPGAAAHDVFWTFQVGFLMSIAAGIGMLLALERHDRRGDLAGCALLAVSMAASGVGLAFVAAALVHVVRGNDRARRSLRVLAVPVGLYALWYLAYGGEAPAGLAPATEPSFDEPLFDNLLDAPRYVTNAAAAALAATTGFDAPFGPALALLAAGLLGWRLARGRPPSAQAWAVLGLAIGYWVLLALARGQGTPNQIHHLYPAVAFVLIVGVQWSRRSPTVSGRALALVALATALVVASHVGSMRDEADNLLREAAAILPRLTALELAREEVDPAFRPLPEFSGPAPDIVADRYFAAIDDYGSPALTVAELEARPDVLRVAADETLIRALGVRPLPGAPASALGSPPTIVSVEGAQTSTADGCVVLRPLAVPASVELRLPPAGLALGSSVGGPVALSARRFGDTFGAAFATVPGGQAAVLRFPADGDPRPWHVKVEAGQRVRLCGLAS